MTADLADFSPEDAELVVSLPYRVGVWISHLEDESGETDDKREEAALVRTIEAVRKKFVKSVFIRSVAAQTLKHQGRWPQWADRAQTVPADCRKVITFLEPQIGKEETKYYRQFLVHIAGVVAEAYGEFGLEDGEKGDSFLGELIEKAALRITGGDFGLPTNVAAVEREAIEELARILKIKIS